jgi:hypothetical protein
VPEHFDARCASGGQPLRIARQWQAPFDVLIGWRPAGRNASLIRNRKPDHRQILLFDQVLTPVTGRAVAIVRLGVIKGIVLSGNPSSVSSQNGSAKAGSRLKLLLAQ